MKILEMKVQALMLLVFGAMSVLNLKEPIKYDIQSNKKKRKIEHRREENDDLIRYKKVQTNQIIGSVQLGIQHVMKINGSEPKCDLIMPDFMTVEKIAFPHQGTEHTSPHQYPDFTFKTYAPFIFKNFRNLYKIQPNKYQKSFCSWPLRELSNPGASGSIFYITHDDKFFMKTITKKESTFLHKLLLGYYMNLKQNPKTLLPKFFGLYRYQCDLTISKNSISGTNKKKIKLIGMNNLLPSNIKIHKKYDLKGSTYNRAASKKELLKSSPTYKDLDFIKDHPNGIFLNPFIHQKLVDILKRDCKVLQSFKIMDYSFLMGVHYVDHDDEEEKKSQNVYESSKKKSSEEKSRYDVEEDTLQIIGLHGLSKGGDKLLLFIGIIDILQSYNFEKKIEHTYKAIKTDGNTVSVHNSDFYASRFLDFITKKVFKISMFPPNQWISELENELLGQRTDGPDLLHAGNVKDDLKFKEKKKIGHRRVNDDGMITYKNISTNQIMGSVQLGIGHAVEYLDNEPERDLLIPDFKTVTDIVFPCSGTDKTPKHSFPQFTFKSYAPVVFRHFRKLYGIKPIDYMISFCKFPLRELSNPGASGSIFYTTPDDKYIMKTVLDQESIFLQKLLAAYYFNIVQNPKTLLPKFFGYYFYECDSSISWMKSIIGKNKKNVRLVVMNNLLPSSIEIHEKYDLKGSTYNRKASQNEKLKSLPTYKDLDFKEKHPFGFFLDSQTYTTLYDTLQRDCRVLESFEIMDYSLLVGVHYVKCDQNTKPNTQGLHNVVDEKNDELQIGAFRAISGNGKCLLLFVGIIDILQKYGFKKKLEHKYKSIIHDGDTVSVHKPNFYATRFLNFMFGSVFMKFLDPLDQSSSSLKTSENCKLDNKDTQKWFHEINLL